MTIVNLAQDYVGSNNLNLLLPNGQYGTRDQGGKDHASARYIFTELSSLSRAVFHTADAPLLSYLKEDNDWIEPEYYMPIIPLVLVNGAEGIGTGWSTTIPCYNPVDIVDNLRRLMAGEELVPMLPWWRGFKGIIKKVGDYKYDVTGVARKINDTTVEITELPIHKWTQTYKAELEAMVSEKGEGVIKDYKEHHDNVNVHFVITMAAKDPEKAEEQGLLEFFRLTSKIQRYASPEEIIEEFYPQRLAYYQKRKDFLANELQMQFERLSNQARFVKMIVDKELIVSNRKKIDIMAELRRLKFRPFPKAAKAKAAAETEDVVLSEGEDAGADEEGQDARSSDYDYLLGMPIWSLTKEKIDKLLQQAADKDAELLALLERTPIGLWNEDLDAFLRDWEKSCREYENKSLLDANGKKIKKKQATLETRKSLTGPGRKKGYGSDDSEDEFKPSKTAAKKTTESKPRFKSKLEAAGLSKVKSDDEKPPKAAPAAKKAPSKEVAKLRSDLEEALPEKTKAMKAESDPDVDFTPTTQVKGKNRVKAKELPKRKSVEVEENSEEDYIKPAAKKKKTTQASVTDFFGNMPPGPSETKKPGARKPSSSKPVVAKKAVPKDSEDEVSIKSDLDASPAPRAVAPKRAARTKTKKYIEVESGSEVDDVSMFEDD